MNIKIEDSWKRQLDEEFSKPYFIDLLTKIGLAYGNEKVFPPKDELFSAFNLTTFDNLKVVILGQDPYHGPGQAHGLSFSVPEGVRTPPSLRNIYKELATDVGVTGKTSGSLVAWAKQGVLLLNSTMTVLDGKPASHKGLGWEIFTDAVIKKISDEKAQVVFLLWGNFAKQKADLIDNAKHLILTATHPSPFSAYNGFLGCEHFSKTNKYLKKTGQKEIAW